MKFVHWLVVGSFFTASFDIILNVNIGGSLRFCQVLMLGVCVAAFARAIQEGRILWPRGSSALALWMVVQAMFVPLSGVMSIGLTFWGLLLFTVVSVLAVVQLYGLSDQIESLMRMYLISYVFVAAFGLVQFALPIAGLPGILVQQWIVHGRLARISGFSYEPSFFATYLMMGWIMLVELQITKAKITEGRLWKVATILVTAALVLSTSKTAWIFMLVEGLARGLPLLLRTGRTTARNLRQGRLLIPVPGRRMVLGGVLLLILMLAGAQFLGKLVSAPTLFLSGTGLGGQPAHSMDARVGAAQQTWEAFKEHPFIGRSLGGVSIYIASRDGIEVKTMEMVRMFWGFPVIMDVLVASGLFGLIPFLVFLYANTFGALKTARRYWPQERAKWVRALARAMIFEWLLLMVDQNLLRTYLWFHITMVAVVSYHLEFAPASAAVARGQLREGGLRESVAGLGDTAAAL